MCVPTMLSRRCDAKACHAILELPLMQQYDCGQRYYYIDIFDACVSAGKRCHAVIAILSDTLPRLTPTWQAIAAARRRHCRPGGVVQPLRPRVDSEAAADTCCYAL